MGGKFPGNTFSAVILKNNASKFENVKEYEGKVVEISGKIKMYKDKPEILIEKKEQIVIVPKEEAKK
jgi:DNA/RNA endonuclease YhcR with UshA esterase domain